MSDDVDRPARTKRAPSPALAALLAPPEVPPREPGTIGQGRDTGAHEVVRRLARRAKAVGAGGKGRTRGTRWLGCLGVGFVALGGDAPAAPPIVGMELACARADVITGRLGAAFQEAPAFLGRQDDGLMSITLTINPVTGTWTLLAIDMASGVACPIVAGDAAKLIGPATTQWRVERGLAP